MSDKIDKTKLSQERKEKIVSFLEEKGVKGGCASCGGTQLMVADHLVTPIVFSPNGGVHLGGTNYPMAMVICSTCYHVNFHAAVPMGLVKGGDNDG